MIDKKTGEVMIDCFGIIINHKTEALKCDTHLMPQYDYALDKEKGVFEVKEIDPVDLTEIIQSNKDNCGMNLALLNIARGVAPEKYCDDGQHGGDFSGSTNINVAYQESLNNKAVAEKLAKELGIDNYQDFTDVESVMKFLKAKAEAQQIINAGKTEPNPASADRGSK